MWYEKIGKWLKDWWGIVVSAVLFVGGFFVGRRSVRGNDGDREQLRSDIEQLRAELASARSTIDELEQINGELTEEAAELRIDIEETERDVRIAKQYHAESGGDIEQLRKLRDRLAELAERYRRKIEQDTNSK